MIIQYYRNQTSPANVISDRLGTFKPLRMTVAVGHPGREMAEMSLDAQGAVQSGIPKAAEDQPNSGAQDWLSSIEKSNLTPRYYLTIGLLVLQEMFEFYDFFLVGYLVSVLAQRSHLTYGQRAMMLRSSAVGAIVGSLIGGQIDDVV